MTKTILIIEDSESIKQVLKEVIEMYDHNLILAKNGKEGVLLYEKAKPDLVLMDLSMPEMCGCETSEKIHAMDPNAKVIVMSGMEDARCEHGNKVQHSGFLKKPFTVDKVVKIISQYLK